MSLDVCAVSLFLRYSLSCVISTVVYYYCCVHVVRTSVLCWRCAYCAGWLLRERQRSLLFHRSIVEIMLNGGHTRVTNGRHTVVEVVGALFGDWSRD